MTRRVAAGGPWLPEMAPPTREGRRRSDCGRLGGMLEGALDIGGALGGALDFGRTVGEDGRRACRPEEHVRVAAEGLAGERVARGSKSSSRSRSESRSEVRKHETLARQRPRTLTSLSAHVPYAARPITLRVDSSF